MAKMSNANQPKTKAKLKDEELKIGGGVRIGGGAGGTGSQQQPPAH